MSDPVAWPEPPEDFDYAEGEDDDDKCPYCSASFSDNCGDEENGYHCRLTEQINGESTI